WVVQPAPATREALVAFRARERERPRRDSKVGGAVGEYLTGCHVCGHHGDAFVFQLYTDQVCFRHHAVEDHRDDALPTHTQPVPRANGLPVHLVVLEDQEVRRPPPFCRPRPDRTSHSAWRVPPRSRTICARGRARSLLPRVAMWRPFGGRGSNRHPSYHAAHHPGRRRTPRRGGGARYSV